VSVYMCLTLVVIGSWVTKGCVCNCKITGTINNRTTAVPTDVDIDVNVNIDIDINYLGDGWPLGY